MASQTVLRFSYYDYAVILNASATSLLTSYPTATVNFTPLFSSLTHLMASANVIDATREDTVQRLNGKDGGCNLSPIRCDAYNHSFIVKHSQNFTYNHGHTFICMTCTDDCTYPQGESVE